MKTIIITTITTIAAPRIGTFWKEQGGIYAGIVAGEDGEPDYYLIHAMEELEPAYVDFQTAIEAAKTPLNGFSDWYLPTRRDARLIAANCGDRLYSSRDYWTSERYDETNNLFHWLPSYFDHAWVQDFEDGNQYHDHQSSDEHHALAVRRVYIQGAAA